MLHKCGTCIIRECLYTKHLNYFKYVPTGNCPVITVLIGLILNLRACLPFIIGRRQCPVYGVGGFTIPPQLCKSMRLAFNEWQWTTGKLRNWSINISSRRPPRLATVTHKIFKKYGACVTFIWPFNLWSLTSRNLVVCHSGHYRN